MAKAAPAPQDSTIPPDSNPESAAQATEVGNGEAKKGKSKSKSKSKRKKVSEQNGKTPGKEQRAFPTFTLEEALKVAEAIRHKTKGKPCDTDLVAEAVGLSRKNPKMWYLTSASRDYGLTIGTRDTPKIELTDL